MRSVNKVILIGNLTRDPEVRQTPNGQAVTTFGIATNRDWVTRDNQRHTSSEFHEVVAWSRLAEISAQYLKKGKLVYIEGYLKTRSWDTPEGTKKFKTEIVIQDMIMLEKREGATAITHTEQGESGDYMAEEGAFNNNETEAPIQQQERKPTFAHTNKPAAPVAPVAAIEEPVAEAQQGPIDIDQDLGL